MSKKYCPICGNTGVKLDGTPCSCRLSDDEFYEGAECLDIPETYRGVSFNSTSLPMSMGKHYERFMQDMYDQLVTMRWKNRNIIICSPNQTGKSILAYSVIQQLFRNGVDVYPIMDVLELMRVMKDIEYNRQTSMGYGDPMMLYTVPYVFAWIPPMLNYDVFDSAAMLLARRVRRGNSTIFLYEGSWAYLSAADTKGSLKNLEGNGSYTTLEVKSFSRDDKGV